MTFDEANSTMALFCGDVKSALMREAGPDLVGCDEGYTHEWSN